MWTGDGATDTVVAYSGATIAASAAGTSSAVLIGLALNTPYSIIVHSGNGASTALTWYTAKRTNGIKLYQWSSNQPSGLSLSGGTAVSETPRNPAMTDFLVDDKEHDATITTASGISFEAPQVFNDATPGWRRSHVDIPDRYVVRGLDTDYSAASFASQFATMKADPDNVGNAYDIPNDNVYATKGSRVLLVHTQDGNFAKVEIVPDPATGMLYSGTSPNKYITVNVSYQPTAEQPYASRPGRFVHEARRSAR
jgi:hypothetical protein